MAARLLELQRRMTMPKRAISKGVVMKRIFFCLLVLMVGIIGAKSFDMSLLVGKTWQCDSVFDEDGVAGKGSSEGIYKKNGTFSGKSKVVYTKPQKYTLEIVESGAWELEGDELISVIKTYSAKSKEVPEIARAIEELVTTSIKESEERDYTENDRSTIVELTKNRLVTKSGAYNSEQTVECKAK